MNFYLIGMSGVGKTSVGRLLGKAMGLAHVDVDRLVAQRSGMKIAEIFEIEGEPGFREREHRALLEIMAGPPSVVSVGAGAVGHPPSYSAMLDAKRAAGSKPGGAFAWLDASDHAIARRLAQSRDRPLLSAGLLEGLALQRSKRSALYESLADAKLVCDGKSAQAIAKELAKRWGAI